MVHRLKDQHDSNSDGQLDGLVPAWIIDQEQPSVRSEAPRLEAPPPSSAWPTEPSKDEDAPRESGGTVIIIDM
jgi:hypothetical protein